MTCHCKPQRHGQEPHDETCLLKRELETLKADSNQTIRELRKEVEALKAKIGALERG